MFSIDERIFSVIWLNCQGVLWNAPEDVLLLGAVFLMECPLKKGTKVMHKNNDQAITQWRLTYHHPNADFSNLQTIGFRIVNYLMEALPIGKWSQQSPSELCVQVI
mgnify:CR=1 FL=1